MNKLNKRYAALSIRLVTGFHLVYGTQDNVFSWDRMLEFSSFLSEHDFPLPTFSAVVSVYCQFLAGILMIIGWQTSKAAWIMVINFSVAIVMVHIGDSYPATFPAIFMLGSSLFLGLNGPGKLSIDEGW